MAQLPGAFNANDHEGMQDFTPVPAGNYIALIEKSEKKEAKTQGNFYWNLTFKIQSAEDGDVKYKGRLLWARLNLINANPKAVEIANNELSTICKAVGKVAIQDTAELHNIPMLITVKVTPATAQYPESNEISNYKRLEGMAAPAAPAASKPSAPAGGEPEPRKRAWEE